jgi:hypothetical protein
MAQNTPKVDSAAAITIVKLDCRNSMEQARQRLLREPVSDTADCNESAAVSNPILTRVASSSLALPAFPAAQDTKSRPAGKNKPLIIAILTGAAVATVIALLLRGGDDDEPSITTPQVTVLAAGTPRVTTP